MVSSNKESKAQGTRPGVFNYLDETAEPSLFRNGKVLARRDKDGGDAGYVGVNQKPYTLDVHDARILSGVAKKTCEANGFELLDAPLQDPSLDFLDHEQVVHRYYRECESLVAESTGARAFAFDHNIRSARGNRSKQRIAGGQAVQGPAKMVHGDYTLVSAPTRLRDLAAPPNVNDTLRSVLPEGDSLISREMVDAVLSDTGRFAIINVWRNIAEEPVQTNPLAMCDGQTVVPEDLVTFEIHYQDRIGENYFAKHHPRHRFFYYPEMTRDEPMLLKQWDSAGALAKSGGSTSDAAVTGGPCTFSFHSAFDDLSTPDDAPDRWSIEVRCLVIYP
jgi:hypothetical protein